MNTKQKIIEAMRETFATYGQRGDLRAQKPGADITAAALDAALAVLAEDGPTSEFKAIINSIRNQEPKP